MSIPIELQARALLELASTKTEGARVLMLRPVPEHDDGGKTERVRDYLDALDRVERIARRSVVDFDRTMAVERLRELAEIDAGRLASLAEQLDKQFDDALAEAEAALSREFWPPGTDRRPAKPARPAVASGRTDRDGQQATCHGDPTMPDLGWRGGHYGRLDAPGLSEAISHLIYLGYDVVEDGSTYSAVWYGGEGQTKIISEHHATEGDAWEFLAAFALGQPPDPDRDDHNHQTSEA